MRAEGAASTPGLHYSLVSTTESARLDEMDRRAYLAAGESYSHNAQLVGLGHELRLDGWRRRHLVRLLKNIEILEMLGREAGDIVCWQMIGRGRDRAEERCLGLLPFY